MEKKGNRNIPAVRGILAESKKDGVSTRQWPRGGQRREPVGNSLSTKNEVSRKPQRVKTLDKRPKPRSSYPVVGRNEVTRVDEQLEPELGSVFLPGSKKQSLNHLLNFSYSPRENSYYPGKGKNVKANFIATKKHKYNKEHFLQANCQFVVNASGNYKQYQFNPDTLVDWDLVEQVNVQVTEFPSCPICLYPPVAAKMTRCGHIYCWSCVLHYLALSDRPSQSKCPICYETVQKQDLKSLIAILHPIFNINETITFKLMKRLKGSLIAYPVDAEVKEDCESLCGFSKKTNKEIYSKLVLAKTNDVMSIIQRELRELTDYLATELDDMEKLFTEQALNLLKEREYQLLRTLDSTEYKNNENDQNTDNDQIDTTDNPTDKNICQTGVITEDILVLHEDMPSTSSSLSKFHYFYQASDGQHIYLHAINARMLEHTYGALQYCPKILTGKILEKEGGSMTEDLRRRLRYLQHLPLTCQFEVAEIYLKPPVVSKDTLDYFQEQIQARRKTRQRRAKEEKRREKRIEVEENRKMGKQSGDNLHLESNIQFPEFGTEPRLRTESQCSGTNNLSNSPDLSGSYLNNCADSTPSFIGPSFASMLATEKKQSCVSTIVKSSDVSTPLKLIHATGSKQKTTGRMQTVRDDEEDLNDYKPVPLFSKTFGDAIAQALEQAEKVDVEEKTENSTSGKKKKKNKQKVLFTTTMTYSGK